MPCCRSDSDYYSEDLHKSRKEANDVTVMLCDTLAGLGQAEIDRLPLQVKNWKAKHDKKDRVRAAQEAESDRVSRVRLQALDKLTYDERKALGL